MNFVKFLRTPLYIEHLRWLVLTTQKNEQRVVLYSEQRGVLCSQTSGWETINSGSTGIRTIFIPDFI